MDLLFDQIPQIYEMMDDDMRLLEMKYNECLSDEEQLALTNCNNILDDFFNSTSSFNSSINSSSGIGSLSLNSSYSSNYSTCSSTSSSSSSSSSSTASSALSSPTSVSSSTCPSFTNLSSLSSMYDDINTFSSSKYNQEAYINNNLNSLQVINPLDLNRNYNNNNNNNANNTNQSQTHTTATTTYIDNGDHNLYHKPTTTITLQDTLSTIRPVKSPSSTPYTQLSKRTKLSDSSPLTTSLLQINNLATHQMQQLHHHQQQQQLPSQRAPFILNSDGESTGSNESDSNSSSDNLNPTSNTTINQLYEPTITKLSLNNGTIIHINTNNNNSNNDHQHQPQQLTTTTLNTNTNATTTPSSSSSSSSSSTNTNIITNLIHANNNQINIIKLNKDFNSNEKQIINYKQLIAKQNLLTTQQSPLTNTNSTSTTTTTTTTAPTNPNNQNKVYPKPPYSYSCLIAMALKNSDSGTLPVSDIYEFIIENFPYYKTARDGWKNSIRHNLSLNKCFEKIENPTNGSKKGCLWALNPEKCKKLEEECKRCRQRDIANIRISMSRPDDLNKIERGEQRLKKHNTNTNLNNTNNNQRKLNDQQQTTVTHLLNTTTTNNSTNSNTNSNNLNNQSTNILFTNTNNTNNDNHNTNHNNNSNNNKIYFDWTTNKTSPILNTMTTVLRNDIIKQEPQEQFIIKLENSDVQFDSILLSSQNTQSAAFA